MSLPDVTAYPLQRALRLLAQAGCTPEVAYTQALGADAPPPGASARVIRFAQGIVLAGYFVDTPEAKAHGQEPA